MNSGGALTRSITMTAFTVRLAVNWMAATLAAGISSVLGLTFAFGGLGLFLLAVAAPAYLGYVAGWISKGAHDFDGRRRVPDVAAVWVWMPSALWFGVELLRSDSAAAVFFWNQFLGDRFCGDLSCWPHTLDTCLLLGGAAYAAAAAVARRR